MHQLKSDEAFTLDRQGLYLVQIDSSSKEGLFINCVDEHFPKITQLKELASCLRYITKKEEYQNITNPNLDTKLELDKFWLSRAGNKNKARLLIRLYYNRIQLANEYFSTYKKGWKTDRGMIYTVFGAVVYDATVDFFKGQPILLNLEALGLPSGTYMIQVISEKNLLSRKVVLERS